MAEIGVDKGKITVHVNLATPDAFSDQIAEDIRQVLAGFDDVTKVEVRFNVKITQPKPVKVQGLPPNHPRNRPPKMTTVKNIIAVASNKGGVGKSTFSANLACALKKLGEKSGVRVALLDLDVYGPNIPTMMGIYDRPYMSEEQKILPVVKHDIPMMSVGFILENEGTPVILRAPLVNKLVGDFTEKVDWGEIDYMVVDLPPGTGDIQLNLAQQLPDTRMIFVTTPQKVALEDVYKGVRMFQQKEIALEILGIVENMSYFVCEHGTRYDLFGKGGGEKVAKTFDIKLFGQVPIVGRVQEQGDKGKPVVLSDPNSEVGQLFLEIARSVTVEVARNNAKLNEQRKDMPRYDESDPGVIMEIDLD